MELCAPLEIIESILLVVFFLHTVRTEGDINFISVEERCIKDCIYLSSIPNVTFSCDGDNSSCDWQCAAQRMGCDIGLFYHCALNFTNHDLNLNQIEYIETCAPEKYCNAGEEPYATFLADGAVRSHKNAVIKCLPCKDPNFYNSRAGQSSVSYSRCYQQKFNKCIPEAHKIDCGDISWRTRKETDGYCRCDAGYAPENEKVKTKCFYTYETCVPKMCPPNQELLSATELLKHRPKLVLLADTTELGWRVVSEYEAYPIVDDIEDEKRKYKAEARASRKTKPDKKRPRKNWPYRRP